jgi:acetyl-CoA acetyltransferase
MVDAVIVSTARIPIGKAFRGAFNLTHGAELGVVTMCIGGGMGAAGLFEIL